MFFRGIFLAAVFLFTATSMVAAKEIVLRNAEAFYKIRELQLHKDALWLEIRLSNHSGSANWYIQVPPPVKEADLYTSLGHGGYRQLHLNDNMQDQLKPVRVNGFLLPLNLGKGDSKKYYLRIKNNYKVKVPVYAGTLEAIYEEEHFKNIVNGFMFGVLLALLVYNLYVYLIIKDLSALYHVGYLFFAVWFLLIWNRYSLGSLQLTLYGSAICWLLALYMNFKKGWKPAANYIAAFVCVPVSYFFYDGFHASMSLQIGLCIQALLLSFALALNLNHLKKETAQLQKKMIDQTSSFSKELITGQEHEKENIANALNNKIGQQLVLLKNEIFVLERQHAAAHQDLFEGITKDIGKAIEEVSNVSFSLRPYQMEILGLKASVERLVEDMTEDTEITVFLDIDETDQLLDKEATMNVYRIIQELLNNLIKHACAQRCGISIKTGKQGVRLYYRDNGKGYDTERTKLNGLGLSGIRERCKLLKARLIMTSMPAAGTRVYMKIPIANV